MDTDLSVRTIGLIHPRNLNGIERITLSTRMLFLNTNFTNRTNISIRNIGLIHPHGKIRVHLWVSVCKKIFVKFVRFVFKPHHPHGKIRVHPGLSVCQKTFVIFVIFVFKKTTIRMVKSVSICVYLWETKIIIRVGEILCDFVFTKKYVILSHAIGKTL